MDFRKWLEEEQLQEIGTSTASIAVFAQPLLAEPVRRHYPDEVEKPKKKKHLANK